MKENKRTHCKVVISPAFRIKDGAQQVRVISIWIALLDNRLYMHVTSLQGLFQKKIETQTNYISRLKQNEQVNGFHNL